MVTCILCLKSHFLLKSYDESLFMECNIYVEFAVLTGQDLDFESLPQKQHRLEDAFNYIGTRMIEKRRF
jgi:hypothetical protein